MKTFLLGVGAQKAGTTWLYEYLKAHPECNMGFTKEYETFTYIDLGDLGHYQLQKPQVLWAMNRATKLNKRDLNLFKLMTFYCDENEYFDYFSRLLENENTLLTGDITPSYAGLQTTTYKRIKDRLEDRKIKPKVILIMRDPVERNISATKLYVSKKSPSIMQDLKDEHYNKMLLVNNQNVINKMTTGYDATSYKLEAVFPKEDILYLFYEDLFDLEKMSGEVKKICDFLGISYKEPNPAPVNESNITFETYPETRKMIYDFYKHVYDFAEDKFGSIPWIRY
jgi:hypothetical protein